MKKNDKKSNLEFFPRRHSERQVLGGIPRSDIPTKGSAVSAIRGFYPHGINSDPLGMWTGVPTMPDDDQPIQDADDL